MFDLFIVVLGLTAIAFLLAVINECVYYFKHERKNKNKKKKAKKQPRVMFNIFCQFVLMGMFLILALGLVILLNVFGFTFI